jgi:PH domain
LSLCTSLRFLLASLFFRDFAIDSFCHFAGFILKKGAFLKMASSGDDAALGDDVSLSDDDLSASAGLDGNEQSTNNSTSSQNGHSAGSGAHAGSGDRDAQAANEPGDDGPAGRPVRQEKQEKQHTESSDHSFTSSLRGSDAMNIEQSPSGRRRREKSSKEKGGPAEKWSPGSPTQPSALTSGSSTTNFDLNSLVSPTASLSASDRKKERKLEKESSRQWREMDKRSGSVIRQQTHKRLRRKTGQNVNGSEQDAAAQDQVVLAGWCKVHQSSMKVGIWVNKWCCLRPGRFISYSKEQTKDHFKDSNGTVIRLVDCEVKERPTTKDGYAFELIHVGGSRQSILTLRVFSENERTTWIAALQEQIHLENKLRWLAAEDAAEQPGNNNTDIGANSADIGSNEPHHASNEGESGTGGEPSDNVGQILKGNTDLRQAVGSTVVSASRQSAIAAARAALGEVDDWRGELDMRLLGFERRVLTNVDKEVRAKKLEAGAALSWWKFALFIFLALLLGRLARTLSDSLFASDDL